jgi:hypothetical protein
MRWSADRVPFRLSPLVEPIEDDRKRLVELEMPDCRRGHRHAVDRRRRLDGERGKLRGNGSSVTGVIEALLGGDGALRWLWPEYADGYGGWFVHHFRDYHLFQGRSDFLVYPRLFCGFDSARCYLVAKLPDATPIALSFCDTLKAPIK